MPGCSLSPFQLWRFRLAWRTCKGHAPTLRLRTVFLFLPQPVAACCGLPHTAVAYLSLCPITRPVPTFRCPSCGSQSKFGSRLLEHLASTRSQASLPVRLSMTCTGEGGALSSCSKCRENGRSHSSLKSPSPCVSRVTSRRRRQANHRSLVTQMLLSVCTSTS